MVLSMLIVVMVVHTVSGSCQCVNKDLCQPIVSKVKPDREIFMFALKNTPKEQYMLYDWNKITTLALTKFFDDDLICYAHSKNTKVVLLVGFAASDLLDPDIRAGWITLVNRTVLEHHMDGAHLDFEDYIELDQVDLRHALYDLFATLAKTLRAYDPDMQVTIDFDSNPLAPHHVYGDTALLEVADFVFLRTYDQRRWVIPATPCRAWAMDANNVTIQGLKNYEYMNIPAHKIILGFAWYGFDYPCETMKADVCTLSLYKGRCTVKAASSHTYAEIVEKLFPKAVGGHKRDFDSWAPYLNYKPVYVAMDTCKHILRLSPSRDHSVLNPQKWLCEVCGTTESVWACLSCSHVACGRYIEEHALKHYTETKHPLALEVNEKYVFCYECDDYILNDNAAGDIKILRSCVGAVATQSFKNMSRSHHRLLRSCSFTAPIGSLIEEKRLRDEDLCFTALWFKRYYTLAKVFSSWKKNTKSIAEKMKKLDRERELLRQSMVQKPSRPKRTLTPGITGLRNLGNTCYMNSVIQVLSNVQEFREHFMRLQALYSPDGSTSPSVQRSQRSPPEGRSRILRQTTMECFQHISDAPSTSAQKGGGLNGGCDGGADSSLGNKTAVRKIGKAARKGKDDKAKVSLSQELHALLRVMWSGKWALVSPHQMLQSVWTAIPFFKGYRQQDAQEFLNEFLGKVQTEIDTLQEAGRQMASSHSPGGSTASLGRSLGGAVGGAQGDVIDKMFQGELVSEVRCLKCGHQSRTFEPFMDLSLDFPARYHWHQSQYRVCNDNCHVEEMLSMFTEPEKLDGEIYCCEHCNSKRRRQSPKRPLYTRAEKRFLMTKLPRVLRLHLKRFTWSGRNHRGKIPVHVDFDSLLDLAEFRHRELATGSALYRLVAVVMHHGRGFGSGHYTAYCYNSEAGSWVHCNDSKMTLCSWDDVNKAQAYILIYVQADMSSQFSGQEFLPQTSVFEEEADSEITFNFRNSSIPKFVELKRKLAEDAKGRLELKRRKTTMW